MPNVLGSQPVAAVRAKIDALVRRVRGGARTAAPPRAQVGGPLDVINDNFHDTYEEARTQARRESPVFVVLADTLLFLHGDERKEYSFSPRAFHVLKSVSHAPVALYAALEAQPDRAVDDEVRNKLTRLQTHVEGALQSLDADSVLAPATRDKCHNVLEMSRAQILQVLAERPVPGGLDAFARRIGPLLLELIHDATALQLSSLHEHVEAALQSLDADQRGALQVVVTGDHQARTRSLGMQYFRKRLAEPDDTEHRVTYAEGVSDEQSALALVGTRRLDRAVAGAFFGDAQRLQRDVLGDAAHALLGGTELSRIA